MEIKKYKLKDLKMADYNPRKMDKNTYEKLKKSLSEFGYIEYIIYNKRTGNIVGGNHRYEVLKSIYGEDYEIDIIEIDIDLAKEKSLNLALNKISGNWDNNKLKEIFSDIEMNDISNLTGFDDFEKSTLLFEMPQLDKTDIIGKQIGMRYPLTFDITSDKDYDIIMKFFVGNNNLDGWKYKTEPNAILLKQMIENYENESKKN